MQSMGLKLSNKDYHARPQISKSDLSLLKKSPYHLWAKKQGLVPPKDSPSLLLGSLVHKLVLEKDEFLDEFYIERKVDKRTKLGKELASIYEQEKRTPAPIASLKQALKISYKIKSIETVGNFLKEGVAEMSYFSELNGVAVKCRPDYYNAELGLVVDLKTTSDASPDGFTRAVASFDYDMQAAFYLDILASLGLHATNFLFIAVETSEPFMLGFYELDNVALDRGKQKYQTLLKRYKDTLANGSVPAPLYQDFNDTKAPAIVQTLSLPAWAFYEKI